MEDAAPEGGCPPRSNPRPPATRFRSGAGTSVSSTGLGTYRITPLFNPNASNLGVNCPALTSLATSSKARGRSMTALPRTRSGASAD